MLKSSLITLGSGLFFSVFSIIVERPLDESLTVDILAQSLIGSGFSISNANMKGSPYSIGTYSNALFEKQGNTVLRQGLAFSTGDVAELNMINRFNNRSTSEEYEGDQDLDNLLYNKYGYNEEKPIVTFDATTFEFDFTLEGSEPIDVSIWHVFGSDEYEEYIYEFHDDLFAVFLDYSNISHVPGSPDDFISVCNINHFTNESYYNSNILETDANGIIIRDENGNPISPYPTEMDGFTTPLNTIFSITDNEVHHLKVVIANTGDISQDSWLLISGTNNLETKEVPEPPTSGMVFIGILLLASFRNRYITRQLKSRFRR